MEFTKVFSTYVEVIPFHFFLSNFYHCILHVCGGDPISLVDLHKETAVFSTYVEVILLHGNYRQVHRCILHVCGGDPLPEPKVNIDYGYSPRMWR